MDGALCAKRRLFILRRSFDIAKQIDWFTIALYFGLVIMGWLNIYAAIYDNESAISIFDLSTNAGKQLLFLGICVLIIIAIFAIDFKIYSTVSLVVYGITVLLLITVLIFAREVNGAKSWLEIGSFRFQPSEFAKFATALVLAKFVSRPGFKMNLLKNQIYLGLLVLVPIILIMLQKDAGTALIYFAFVIVLFREGMSPIPLVLALTLGVLFILTLLVDQLYIGIGMAVIAALAIAIGRKTFKRIALILVTGLLFFGVALSVDYVFKNVLLPHQQNRVLVLLNPNSDPLGAGWNVTQSKIAIGSGGVTGKGFLMGTQTKFDFVPEQSTDFIFCTIGEEQGWIGSLVIILGFMTLILRIIRLAERQKSIFARVYGYSVASILFFHFAVNIGMTIGLFPVVGIPLPFFSYGGSSLIGFTILLFIFLKLDAHRMQMLERS